MSTCLERLLGGIDNEKRNILRLKIRIVFKTVVKRGIVEVYLDPRVPN